MEQSTQHNTNTVKPLHHHGEHYGISDWGADYFDVDAQGNVVVTLSATDTVPERHVALIDIVAGMQARGMEMPSILRIDNLLDERITALNEAFHRAIQMNDYQSVYRGVFPIKVNQQAHVIEEIANFGERYHHGFEAGSKAELIIAMSSLRDNRSLIVCNGYKDAEFIELGLYAMKMGMQCFFVLETPAELPTIIELSKKMDIKPLLGVRIRPTVQVDGHWQSDSGDKSIFGLSTGSLDKVINMLTAHDMLDCLQLLHCHIGSQIPNIRNVRSGVLEAARYYIGLKQVGATMGYIDLGGGLGVDYEGTKTNSTHSMNYQLDEYCVNVVETLCETLNAEDVAHPVIITESGRATVAYSSMLMFDILDVRDHRPMRLPQTLPTDAPELLRNLWASRAAITAENYQECYNDALYYREEARELFLRGQISLAMRTLADNIALAVFEKVAEILKSVERVPAELESLPIELADIYYGNFSLFQSLPDIWAIDQLLPVMPLHRLHEAPTREAVIADLTCDSDGKISAFSTPDGVKPTLPLHPLIEGQPYYLGVFLIGAYQETLGDLHNLFGDTNVVSVHINDDGSFDFMREFHGDSIADVLNYVEYEPKHMVEAFRQRAELAVREGTISATTRKSMMKAFKDSLDGYTYFEKES